MEKKLPFYLKMINIVEIQLKHDVIRFQCKIKQNTIKYPSLLKYDDGIQMTIYCNFNDTFVFDIKSMLRIPKIHSLVLNAGKDI